MTSVRACTVWQCTHALCAYCVFLQVRCNLPVTIMLATLHVHISSKLIHTGLQKLHKLDELKIEKLNRDH